MTEKKCKNCGRTFVQTGPGKRFTCSEICSISVEQKKSKEYNRNYYLNKTKEKRKKQRKSLLK